MKLPKLANIVSFIFLIAVLLVFLVSFLFIKYFVPEAAEHEAILSIQEKKELVSTSMLNYLHSGDWIAMKRLLLVMNQKSKREVFFMVDFTGQISGVGHFNEKLSPQLIQFLEDCALYENGCELENTSSYFSSYFDLKNVRFFVEQLESFGDNNSSLLVIAVDFSQFTSSKVRELFSPLLLSLMMILFFFFFLMYVFILHGINYPIENLIKLFNCKDLKAKDVLYQKRKYLPQEILKIYARVREYLFEKEEEMKKNELLQEQLIFSKRNEAIAQATQMLAHDVRKPFSSMSMLLESLRSMDSLWEVKKITSFALPEVQRSLEMVNGLIQDVMEIGSNSSLHFQMVDPFDMIIESLKDVFRVYVDSNITINSSFEHSYFLEIDKNKVMRVFSNIISNALQAMNFKGSLFFATRNIFEEKTWIEFSIANSGPLIEANSLLKLFDAFFTTGKKGGTGLGLAIAHKIVTAHGGRIRCESEEGRGVCFIFTLPASSFKKDYVIQNLPSHSSFLIQGKESFFHNDGGEFQENKNEIQDVFVSTHLDSLKFAFVEDSHIIRLRWKMAWKNGELVDFSTPEDFWKEVESNPSFLSSLACVITDFDFDSLSLEDGGTFAACLRKRTHIPIFLSSNFSKFPLSKEQLLDEIKKAKEHHSFLKIKEE